MDFPRNRRHPCGYSEAMDGKRVAQSYEQYFKPPTGCIGKTEYFVIVLRVIE